MECSHSKCILTAAANADLALFFDCIEIVLVTWAMVLVWGTVTGVLEMTMKPVHCLHGCMHAFESIAHMERACCSPFVVLSECRVGT